MSKPRFPTYTQEELILAAEQKMLPCIGCGKLFLPTRPNQLRHTKGCGRHRRQIYDQGYEYEARAARSREMAFQWCANGAIYELRVACDLMKDGWVVCRSLAGSAPFDLLIWKAGITLRVEVKGAREYQGRVIPTGKASPIGNHDVLALVLADRIVYQPELPPCGYASPTT